MMARRTTSPRVSGTKMKWKKTVTANCNRDSMTTSIEFPHDFGFRPEAGSFRSPVSSGSFEKYMILGRIGKDSSLKRRVEAVFSVRPRLLSLTNASARCPAHCLRRRGGKPEGFPPEHQHFALRASATVLPSATHWDRPSCLGTNRHFTGSAGISMFMDASHS